MSWICDLDILIVIFSIAGHYLPFSPEFNVYSSSKYGVTAFSGALLSELADAKSRIKVTVSSHLILLRVELTDVEVPSPIVLGLTTLY